MTATKEERPSLAMEEEPTAPVRAVGRTVEDDLGEATTREQHGDGANPAAANHHMRTRDGRMASEMRRT
ncbi:hypothetical protein Syun_009114 [Stephania yunnanensis]|uniref:Uncharacterized protein n=1 Tax=Stephania yunnanensis TaxID=152371 RepID=A0AAP0PQK8_9MAGN